jgi:CHRD domain
MKPRVLVLVISLSSALMMLSVPAAHAIPLTFTTTLSGANEVPPTASPGTGFATVVLDPAAETLQLNVTFSGLTSNDMAAHIHCCLLAGGGPNLVVATTVPAFPGFPLGVTSGTYSSPVFDLTQSLIYNSAFVTAEGGIPQAEAALIFAITNGLSYLNIHTTTNPGGEIRGQLSPVPLPGALPLFVTGLGALGLLGWRRKRKAAALT